MDLSAAWYLDQMKFTLLTHRKEFGKRSNTGQLVVDVLGDAAEQVCWERTRPPEPLLREIRQGGVALVYPGAADEAPVALASVRQFVVIDGTWITARKVHQRSPYLHTLQRVSLQPTMPSQYNLRQHQKDGCLCTAECVVEVLRALQDPRAEQLHARFLAFIKPPAVLRGEALSPPMRRRNRAGVPIRGPAGLLRDEPGTAEISNKSGPVTELTESATRVSLR